MAVYLPVWYSHCTRATFTVWWCHALVSLQFTHVRSFGYRDRLQNSRADCSTVGLYCVTKDGKIIKGSLQVTVAGVLLHVTVENRHVSTLAGNAARQWLLRAVSHCWIRFFSTWNVLWSWNNNKRRRWSLKENNRRT